MQVPTGDEAGITGVSRRAANRVDDFVGLSARVKDVEADAARMRAPLADLRDKVAAFRSYASVAVAALRAGLEQRAAAARAPARHLPHRCRSPYSNLEAGCVSPVEVGGIRSNGIV